MDKTIAPYKEMLLSLLSSQQIPFDENIRRALSQSAGVYRIFEIDALWQDSVYVGRTSNLQTRIYSDHFMGNRQASTLKRKLIKSGRFADETEVKEYLRDRCLVQFFELTDDTERKWFEHFAVAVLRPEYND